MHQTFNAALEINLLHANQEGANHIYLSSKFRIQVLLKLTQNRHDR